MWGGRCWHVTALLSHHRPAHADGEVRAIYARNKTAPSTQTSVETSMVTSVTSACLTEVLLPSGVWVTMNEPSVGEPIKLIAASSPLQSTAEAETRSFRCRLRMDCVVQVAPTHVLCRSGHVCACIVSFRSRLRMYCVVQLAPKLMLQIATADTHVLVCRLHVGRVCTCLQWSGKTEYVH